MAAASFTLCAMSMTCLMLVDRPMLNDFCLVDIRCLITGAKFKLVLSRFIVDVIHAEVLQCSYDNQAFTIRTEECLRRIVRLHWICRHLLCFQSCLCRIQGTMIPWAGAVPQSILDSLSYEGKHRKVIKLVRNASNQTNSEYLSFCHKNISILNIIISQLGCMTVFMCDCTTNETNNPSTSKGISQ